MSETPFYPMYDAHLQDTVAGAAAVLTRKLDGPVRLEIAQNFRGERSRATVLRCRLLGGNGSGGPETVIVKRFRAQDGGAYDIGDKDVMGPHARCLNEWAGAAFLSTVDAAPRLGPAVFGGDAQRGLIVLEDLGEGVCLADLLQGSDAGAAEAALVAYAATIGRLHASTIGRAHDYAALRAELATGGSCPAPWDPIAEWRDEGLPKFRSACSTLGLAMPDACEVDFADVADAIARPGPFLAYSVSDTCPDNHRYTGGQDGDAGHVRFFDMEFGGYRSALLDAAYLWMPFPTCWCVNRLPVDLPPRLEGIYRAALLAGCPEAADDGLFGHALAAACAVWWVLTVSWDFARVVERDDEWGIATVRQRMPLRAESLSAVANRYDHFPALAALAQTFAARLRERWGPEVEMPLYPPFRG